MCFIMSNKSIYCFFGVYLCDTSSDLHFHDCPSTAFHLVTVIISFYLLSFMLVCYRLFKDHKEDMAPILQKRRAS